VNDTDIHGRWGELVEHSKAIDWRVNSWSKAKARKKINPGKQELLRRSLDLVRGQSSNEQACRKVIETALEFGLFDIVAEAMRTFAPESAFDLCVAVQKVFKEVGHWPSFDEPFVEYCEKRVLAARKCPAGMYMGDYPPDQRSEALGLLGRYRFFTGDSQRAISLWTAAGEPRDVDKVIAEMCETIVKRDKEYLEAALKLAELIGDPNIKAMALTALSRYV
jgi:hypothetical protein